MPEDDASKPERPTGRDLFAYLTSNTSRKPEVRNQEKGMDLEDRALSQSSPGLFTFSNSCFLASLVFLRKNTSTFPSERSHASKNDPPARLPPRVRRWLCRRRRRGACLGGPNERVRLGLHLASGNRRLATARRLPRGSKTPPIAAGCRPSFKPYLERASLSASPTPPLSPTSRKLIESKENSKPVVYRDARPLARDFQNHHRLPAPARTYIAKKPLSITNQRGSAHGRRWQRETKRVVQVGLPAGSLAALWPDCRAGGMLLSR